MQADTLVERNRSPVCAGDARSFAHPIAILDPLGDYGLGAYTYELAEGLSASGASVDVYASGLAPFQACAVQRHHRFFPVLGSALFKQLNFREPAVGTGTSAASVSSAPSAPVASNGRRRGPLRPLKDFILGAELALHLKRSGYQAVWTQWPLMDRYGVRFWRFCKTLGLPLVHTVHNVLPHEEAPGDAVTCKAVYELADVLHVHSECTRDELVRFCPASRSKVVVAPHGLYTMYQRQPQVRSSVRRELDIADDEVALLFFGGVRPYKNLDAVLRALQHPGFGRAVLVVAGRESGYPNLVPQDDLGRTRRLAAELQITERVRLLPGVVDLQRTSELFEASDIILLPYKKSYGSGLLLLAMTFGKHIALTATGGMEEYVRDYTSHTVLASGSSDDILKGLQAALASVNRFQSCSRPAEFEWVNVGRQLLEALAAKFSWD